MPTKEQVINSYIIRKTKSKWELIERLGDSGAQFKLPKRFSALGFWLGLITLPFGIGLIFWLLAIIDYIAASGEIVYVSVEDMYRELKGVK